MLDTALRLEGKPVRLQFIVWKPNGEGPFPVLLFNHGSTGRGTEPTMFRKPYFHEPIGRYFTERGWMVVTPMRRGRGWSDGLYDEGFGVPRAGGYTCITDWSLAGSERALADLTAAFNVLSTWPEVDASRIVVGGQSRGGILAVTFAGRNLDRVGGVINFVGGWMAEICPNAGVINGTLVTKHVSAKPPMLWLYGDRDPYYSLDHSRWFFDRFTEAGGKATYHAIEPNPGASGHGISYTPELWQAHVNKYMTDLGFTAFGN